MFLDDELYNLVKGRQIEKAEDFSILVTDCYGLCEKYYKSKLSPDSTDSCKEITNVLDKTFTFWDMFVKKLDKANYPFADLFTIPGVSFKDNFMSHGRLKEIYLKGK